jgi:subtilase family serine protease
MLVVGVLVCCVASLGAPPDRLHGRIGEAAIALPASIRPEATVSNDRGPLDATRNLTGLKLVLKQTPEQMADLEQFLERQRDPATTDYHNWLTPEQYGERFGVSQNDLDRLAEWLRSMELSVDTVARARNWIVFSGTAGQVSRAFRTEMHRYQTGRETHFANASAPLLPAVLADMVDRVTGMDDFRPAPQTGQAHRRVLKPDFTASSGAHYLTPDDLATIYNITPLFQAGIDGAGQKLAIAGQTDINLSDIRTFRSTFGLSAKDPQLVLYGADPGVSPGDEIEADLDIEWAGAVARNATIVYVYSQDVFSSVQYAVDQALAPVLSVSYGGCEAGSPASFRSVAQQANAEGITWMSAAGDSGAAGCDWDATVATHGPSVIFPANIPEVTAVGGTEFSESGSSGWNAQNGATWASATGYLAEKAWNDSSLGQGIAAGGGGVSAAFSKPWWQTGPGVPNDQARDVPDIALSASGAHDGYLIYANGSLMAVGGTSAASPSFAGIVTLLNQYLVVNGGQAKTGLGNINPNLYAIAQTPGAPVHDIVSGDNIVPCASGSKGCVNGSFGYKAGAGYDLATGLGSVDAYNLALKWRGTAAMAGTTMTLMASPSSISQTGITQLTAIVSPVTGSAQPAGTVVFVSGSKSLGSAPLVVPGGAVSGGSASAILKVSASSLAAGVNAVNATFQATGSFASSTAETTVTVTQPVVSTTTSVAAAPASIATSATAVFTATVKPSSGTVPPAGSVTFSSGATTLARVPLIVSGTSATATLSVAGTKLPLGANSVVASYSATGNFGNSTASVSISVTSSPISTAASLTAAPASLLTTGSTVFAAVVKPASGSTAPSGTVTFSLGSTVLGTATLAASGSSSSASLTVAGTKLKLGSNAVTASYAGSTNGGSAAFASCTSTPVTVTVAAPSVATSLTVTASPATIASGGTTLLSVTAKSATGSSPPLGAISFALGGTVLGNATLTGSGASASANLTIAAKSLQTGSNSIVATYSGASGFASSSGTVTITLSASPVSTTTVVTAAPASIAPTGSTQITATVKAASGPSAPSGTVVFTLGKTSLGSVSAMSSTGTISTASLAIKGSTLASGANAITATFVPAGNFAGSAGSVTATVTPPLVATTTTLSAGSTALIQSATTKLTVTVKAASGTAPPSGTVTLTIGGLNLGSAPLSVVGPNATATLALQGASLPQKLNTVTATYSGSAVFASSSAGVSITAN